MIKSTINKIKWSLRRLVLPVAREALVLEVGSGGNPYPRSNVLVDAYEESRERFWVPLVRDRPTVLSYGENLPFKDKVFDYVIAAHVLEHTADPEKFLRELQRVARAGYIETPDAFMERINPYKDHRLEVTVRNNTLVLRKKPDWIVDPDLVEFYENRAKNIISRETIPGHAESFHVRFFWNNEINFTLINPEVDAEWPAPNSSFDKFTGRSSITSSFRLLFLRFVRRLFSQGRRNSKLDILPLMRCPDCCSDQLERIPCGNIKCTECDFQFTYSQNTYYIN